TSTRARYRAASNEELLAAAVIVEERAEAQPQLFRQILFLQRLKEGHRRAEGAHERGAFRTAGEMLLQLGADVGRQAAVEVVGEQGDDPGAGRGHHLSMNLRSKK